MILGFSAKNWLKIRYCMLDLKNGAGQCYQKLVPICTWISLVSSFNMRMFKKFKMY